MVRTSVPAEEVPPVQTPTIEPGRAEARTDPERVLLIPEAEEPRRRIFIVLGVLALIVAMALGGGIVYVWQHGQVMDAQADVHTANVAAAAARDEGSAALAQVEGLQNQIAGLEDQLA